MRVQILTAGCLTLAACLAAESVKSENEPPAALTPDDGVLGKLRSKLQAPARLEFIETPLSDVIEFMQDEHELEFELDKDALKAEGVDPETPLTSNLAGISLRDGLQLILEPLRLEAIVAGKTVLVTTREQASGRSERREYPTLDLERAWGADGRTRLRDLVLAVVPLDGDRREPADAGPKAPAPPARPASAASIETNAKGLSIHATQSVHLGVERLLHELRRIQSHRRTSPGEIVPNPAELSPTARPKSADEAIALGLMRSTKVTCVETPLADVIELLKDQHEMLIQLCKHSIENDGIDSNTPITVVMEQASLRASLRSMLEPLGLTAIRRHGVLMVTTQTMADLFLERQVFDVRDLIGPEKQRLEALIKAVRANVAPKSWRGASAGGRGEAREFEGFLVVLQTYPNQWEIATLLAQLRRLTKAAPGGTLSEPATTPVITKGLAGKQTLEFAEAPLSDVLDFCRDAYYVPVHVDRRAMEDASIDSDQPVTLKKVDLTWAEAMAKVLDERKLTWLERDEFVVITTTAHAETLLLRKVYDLRPWLKPDGWLSPTVTAAFGDAATVHNLAGLVVVRRTPRQHREIAAALEKLRPASGK